MKKVIIMLGIAAMVAAFAGCKKTCDCTVTTKTVFTDELWGEDGDMDGIITTKIETKGKCSDLDGKQVQNMMGMKMITETKCK